jgi:hypothetical protein
MPVLSAILQSHEPEKVPRLMDDIIFQAATELES